MVVMSSRQDNFFYFSDFIKLGAFSNQVRKFTEKKIKIKINNLLCIMSMLGVASLL